MLNNQYEISKYICNFVVPKGFKNYAYEQACVSQQKAGRQITICLVIGENRLRKQEKWNK